jgi:excisionase family DNA binding protein
LDALEKADEPPKMLDAVPPAEDATARTLSSDRRRRLVSDTTPNPTPAPVYGMSVREAAERIGISRGSVYNLIWAGTLVPRKFGSRTILLSSDVDAFLASLPAADLRGLAEEA